MFRKRAELGYKVPLDDLTERQLLQQILLTLERMEKLLISNNEGSGGYPADFDRIAERIAAGIDRNTEKLSEITLFPDFEPRGSVYPEGRVR